MQLLDRINHGYGELEPVIIGLMAMNKSFMLIGRHGTGKTRLAKMLSQGYGEKGFVFYDATKDDLISIAGIPDPEAIRQGKLRFIPHERSIWDKNTIVVDEITRAGKESQNLWLEILEERSCFGLPLPYRTLIATANPESYASAFQLDEALLDRFYAVVPVPEMQKSVQASDITKMIDLAVRDDDHGLEAEEIARCFTEIQTAHNELFSDDTLKKISAYLGRLVPSLLAMLAEQNGPFLSPRTYSRNLPESILAVAAYFMVNGKPDPLEKAAVEALRYSIATKIQIKPAILEQLHDAARSLLRSGGIKEADKIRFELSALSTFEERLGYLEKHWETLKTMLKEDEIEKYLGDLLRGASKKGEQEKLVVLEDTLKRLNYRGDALRQVDGKLMITLNHAIGFVMPRLLAILARESQHHKYAHAVANIKKLQHLISSAKFMPDKSPEMLRLKAYLIDLYEHDLPSDDGSLLEYFEKTDFSKM